MPHELRCQGTKADGTPCGAAARFIDPDTGYCASHDPAKREKLLQAARKGGKATARRNARDGLKPDELPDLESPQDAAKRLDLIAQAVGTGRLGHQEGRTMTGAVKEWLKAFEAGSLADRVEELQQQLAEARGAKLERVK